MGFLQQIGNNIGIEIPIEKQMIVTSGWADDLRQEYQKSSTWPLIDAALNMLDRVPQAGDVTAFAEVYASVIWLYVAVWTIQSSIGSLELEICEGDKNDFKVIEKGLAYELFQEPNLMESRQDFIEDLVGFLELTGNGYVEKADAGEGKLPTKLFNLEPYYMSIISDKKKKIGKYKWCAGRGIKAQYFEPEEIMHVKYSNPTSQFYGMGIVQPLQSTLITELYRETYTKSHFENEARPDIILKHNADIEKGVPPLLDAQKRQVAMAWYKTFGGPRKNRLPLLLESGMDISILSEARKDMDFRELEKSLRERIFAGAGIPPILAGITESVNYANAKEQLKIFWTVTIPPKCNKITNAITRSILKPFDKKLWCRFNLDNIPALSESPKEMEERLSRVLERAGMTLGEYSSGSGFPMADKDPLKDIRILSSNFINANDALLPLPEGEGEEGEPQGAPFGEKPEEGTVPEEFAELTEA